MVQIKNVSQILEVKNHLDSLKQKDLIKEWELPYENILTRLTAAIFFLTPKDETSLKEIWSELEQHEMLTYSINVEKELSKMEWRFEFNEGFEL
ncbi:hypothetical protein [Dokdonia sp.]|uniref:hypothetical protein n=1 Tax=Dokdonia sp. TaxID=2024995 RepID=UPI0032638D23